MPILAEALLDVAIAMDIMFKRKLESPNQPALFEKHVRRGVHVMAEIYPRQLSWYLCQLKGSVVHEMREHLVLGMHTQQCVEQVCAVRTLSPHPAAHPSPCSPPTLTSPCPRTHLPPSQVNQVLAATAQHSNHGANVGRMTTAVKKDPSQKADYMEGRATRTPSEPESLFRRMLFQTLATTKSMRQADPEIGYGAALALMADRRARGLVMEHPDFEADVLMTNRFVRAVARWRRIWRTGAGMSSNWQDHPSGPLWKPARSIREVYRVQLHQCAHLLPPELRPTGPAPPPVPPTAPNAEKFWCVGGVALVELLRGRYLGKAFLTEILKTPFGRGRGPWGSAMIGTNSSLAQPLALSSLPCDCPLPCPQI